MASVCRPDNTGNLLYVNLFFSHLIRTPFALCLYIYIHEGPLEGSNGAISIIDFKARTAPLMSLGYLYPFISFTLFVHLMFYF